MKLTIEEKKKVIKCCNVDLIPDADFDLTKQYPIDWFKKKFDFIDDIKLQEHLADIYYQARFSYTLMRTLSLSQSKYKGILKLQIIEYASICEALLNYSINKFFKDEFEEMFAIVEYTNVSGSISSKFKTMFDGQEVFICKKKTNKFSVSFCSNPQKAVYAHNKGIISLSTKDAYCTLYDLRNNTHIIKAVKNDYYPKISEGKMAYELLNTFIEEVRNFFVTQQKHSIA